MTEPLDPDEFAELKMRVSRLRVDEAETRWLALKADQDIQTLDQDIQSLRDDLRQVAAALGAFGDRFDNLERRIDDRFDQMGRRFDNVEQVLVEQGGKTDSLGAQVRSLTQLVGREHGGHEDEVEEAGDK